jgi:hypothetical protein
MMTIEASTEAMKTPSVVLLRTVHYYGASFMGRLGRGRFEGA